eukprot:COSAG05_NODE_1_length_66591_cov_307.301581_45_plen_196_part_00
MTLPDSMAVIRELDSDGSGSIGKPEFEDWFEGLRLGGKKLTALQQRAALSGSSIWGLVQRQPAEAKPNAPLISRSGFGSLLWSWGFRVSPSQPLPTPPGGAALLPVRPSFSLGAHGSGTGQDGCGGWADALSLYVPQRLQTLSAEAAGAEEVAAQGRRLAFALLSFLAAQYGWQTVPCAAVGSRGATSEYDEYDD